MKHLTTHALHVFCIVVLGLQNAYATVIPEFDTDKEHIILDGLEVLQDNTCTLNIQDVSKAGSAFTPLPPGIPNLGIENSANWIRLSLHNKSGLDNLVLRLGHYEMDELDIYMLGEDGIVPIGSSGLSRQESRNEAYGLTFSLPLASGDVCYVYLRVRSFKQMHVPIYVGPHEAILGFASKREFLAGGLLAIVIVMALYNLFIFISTRDKSYLWYVATIVCTGLAQLTILGYGQSFFSEYPWFAARISRVLVILGIGMGIQFARHFIGSEGLSKIFKTVAQLFYVGLAACLGVFLFIDPVLGYKASNAISGMSALYLLIYVISAIRKSNRQAKFYLLAWAPFLIGVLLYVMKDEGVLPYNYITVFAMPAGAALETVLLSFGLAEKIRQLRIQKEASQKEALNRAKENEQLIKTQNMVLEIKVNERTAELQATNEELKMTQSQLVDAEKMASLGQLTAGIAHEINNPINFITSNIPPLRRDLEELVELFNDQQIHLKSLDDEKSKAILEKAADYDIDFTIDELDEIIGSIDTGAKRTIEIVRGLRNFSRLDEDDTKFADVNEGVRSTLGFLPPELKKNIHVSMELEEIGEIECLPGKLNQLILNLVTNGLQAIRTQHGDEEGGMLTVRTKREENDFVLQVEDNGCGMTEAVKEKVFEPFFTTKDVGEGTGLGLSISHGIAESHNGSFDVESEVKKGTIFTLRFPIIEHKLKKSA